MVTQRILPGSHDTLDVVTVILDIRVLAGPNLAMSPDRQSDCLWPQPGIRTSRHATSLSRRLWRSDWGSAAMTWWYAQRTRAMSSPGLCPIAVWRAHLGGRPGGHRPGSAPGVQPWGAAAFELLDPAVPCLAVSGTNGKTTTRLIAPVRAYRGNVHRLVEHGRCLRDGELVETGDFSGPAGARRYWPNQGGVRRS